MALDYESGEPGRNRTFNPQIKSLLLCQLSYRPTLPARRAPRRTRRITQGLPRSTPELAPGAPDAHRTPLPIRHGCPLPRYLLPVAVAGCQYPAPRTRPPVPGTPYPAPRTRHPAPGTRWRVVTFGVSPLQVERASGTKRRELLWQITSRR